MSCKTPLTQVTQETFGDDAKNSDLAVSVSCEEKLVFCSVCVFFLQLRESDLLLDRRNFTQQEKNE
jgi:hypothetical protein